MMPQRNQEKDIATTASIWFEIWGVVDPGQKISISTGKFPKNFDFFRQLKKFDFPRKKLSIYSISLQKYTNHFRTYFLYMIRYNNISRPVHDSNDPPATLPTT